MLVRTLPASDLFCINRGGNCNKASTGGETALLSASLWWSLNLLSSPGEIETMAGVHAVNGAASHNIWRRVANNLEENKHPLF